MTRPPIDPEIAAVLDTAPALSMQGPLTRDTLPAMRARQAAMPQPPLSDRVERTTHVVDEVTGVTVRVHRPVEIEGAQPCLYWMHGGGLIAGSALGDDLRFDRWCPSLGMVGVSVEYRLAPEHPFPAPIEDCWAGLRWVVDHAGELGVDRTRIGIGGASAGGGLAAALALLARDGGLDLAYQLLLYPMLDDRQVTESSGWDVPIWDPAANDFGWRCYLGDAKGTDDVPPHAAAARAADLAGLPPAFVLVGALDGFLDEDVDHAMRLTRAGVPTELHVYPGAPHGFDGFFDAPVSRQARSDTRAWVARQLGVAPSVRS